MPHVCRSFETAKLTKEKESRSSILSVSSAMAKITTTDEIILTPVTTCIMAAAAASVIAGGGVTCSHSERFTLTSAAPYLTPR